MNNVIKSISVIGLGYIGLPTACLLANSGYKVYGCDINHQAVERINAGESPIVEHELDSTLASVVASGSFKAFTTPQLADVYILAVPTPFTEDHNPDLSHVEAATKAIAPLIKPGNLIILESTSPIGTTEKVASWLSDARPELNIPTTNTASTNINQEQVYIAHCPERVLPGRIFYELVENDRVIGGIDDASKSYAQNFYQSFVKGATLSTNSRTAEMVKLCENAYRDVNIAFANELSLIADHVGVDVWEVIRIANHHPRVNILQPGPGVGGHCIAVDPWFIVAAAPEQSKLIKVAREVNDSKPHYIVDRVKKAASTLKNPVIACLGLSYKANIDDFRESPALEIAQSMLEAQLGKLLVAEPYAQSLPESLKEAALVDLNTAIQQADIVVLLVNHRQFEKLDLKLLADKIIIDTRGLWA